MYGPLPRKKNPQLTNHLRKWIVAGSIGVTATILGASTVAFAGTAAESSAASGARTAEGDTPPSIVEDFTYPGADKVFAEWGITLKRGDGHIVLAVCDGSDNEIKVMARGVGRDDEVCFKALAANGYLTLEVPDVYAIRTQSRPVRVELTAEDKSQTVDVPANVLLGVGEGIGQPPTVLLELRVTG